MRKGEPARAEMAEEVNGHIWRDAVEVRRWAGTKCPKCRRCLEANRIVIGNRWIQVLGEVNERRLSIEEVREALKEMKLGKTPNLALT